MLCDLKNTGGRRGLFIYSVTKSGPRMDPSGRVRELESHLAVCKNTAPEISLW